MDDDKRAEAMRRAIEESDAENKSVKRNDSGSRGRKKESSGDGILNTIKDLFSSRMAKIILIVIIVAVVAIIAIAVVMVRGSGGRTKKVSAQPIEYEVVDGVICPYESSSSSTGYAFDAYVEVVNTGDAPMYLSDGQFQISDANENRLMVEKTIYVTPAVIQPGETGYLYTAYGDELIGVESSDVDCYLTPAFYAGWCGDAVPNCSVNDVLFENDASRATIELTNLSEEDYENVVVSVVTYNGAGYATGITVSDSFAIAGNETKSVTIDNLNRIRAWVNEPTADYDTYVYFSN